MASIYLAGKIGKGDWRHDLVPFLHETWGGPWYSGQAWALHDDAWPVLPSGVLGIFDYTGPYFTESCTHSEEGCEQTEHRLGSFCEGDQLSGSRITHLCLDAINRSDIVFAWLNDCTAYGTLAEIGYAHGRGKTVVIATPVPPKTPDVTDSSDWVKAGGLSELWFACSLATRVIRAESPRAAVEQIAGAAPQLDSPIEIEFWDAYLRSLPTELLGLKTQVPALGGRYRIDFALPDKKIGIELDGYAWHSSREAFTKDRERQRALELDGWRIIRFSGAEINTSAERCVAQTAALIRQFDEPPAPTIHTRRPGEWPTGTASGSGRRAAGWPSPISVTEQDA